MAYCGKIWQKENTGTWAEFQIPEGDNLLCCTVDLTNNIKTVPDDKSSLHFPTVDEHINSACPLL